MAYDHSFDMVHDASLAEQLAAVQGWWHDAGVDFAFVDAPQAMLKGAEPEAKPPVRRLAAPVEQETAPAPVRIDLAGMPPLLGDFREWWCDPASPLPLPAGPRVAPMGNPGARLMLLAPMPETGDSTVIFAGPQGRLLRRMLDALEVDDADAYFATALPVAMDMPDWASLGETGLGTIIVHHIALVRPQRLLVLGSALAPMVRGIDTPALGSYSPDQLLAHPPLCARLWPRLLDWMPAA